MSLLSKETKFKIKKKYFWTKEEIRKIKNYLTPRIIDGVILGIILKIVLDA